MSKLECAMEQLIKLFHSYAREDNDKYTLSKAELKKLITAELPTLCPQGAQKTDSLDKTMKDLDTNGDQQLDFQEFVIMMAGLAINCNDFFVGHQDPPKVKAKGKVAAAKKK
ncbi:unnamed protein product [Lampetra planeri]